MNHTKELIISLLSQGVSAVQVASSAGVSEAYVSQLRHEPEIAAKIASVSVGKLEDAVVFDTALERAEMLALKKIETQLNFANFNQALGAFKILNAARKRSDARPAGENTGTTVNVNLTLPAAAASRYIVNSSNEVVEVDGKAMITATATSLDSLLAQRSAAKLQQPDSIPLNRAANMLQQISLRPHAHAAPRARRLPAALSADVL